MKPWFTSSRRIYSCLRESGRSRRHAVGTVRHYLRRKFTNRLHLTFIRKPENSQPGPEE